MSRTDRWYTLARELADGQSDYVFIGWSRTKEAAIARRDKLPEAREALNLYASSRVEAANALPVCYEGRKVKGWMSAEDKRAGRMIVKAAVMRAIFCPFTGVILDMRRAVVVVTSTRSFVMAATHWDEVRPAIEAALARAEQTVDVYDGRELFK